MLYYTIIPFCTHFITYWSSCYIFYLLDLKYLDKNHINWSKYQNAIKTSLINQFTISLPTLYFIEDYTIIAINKSINDSYFFTFNKILLIINMSNMLFYIFHRLLHTKFFYNIIHYKHHEFIEPIAVASLYSHPFEHLFANTLSFLIPFIIVGIPYYTMLILTSLGTFITVTSHANYKVISNHNDHLIHHKLYKYNYGFGGYLDKILSTYYK